MKRSEHLEPLSHDHQYALMAARRLVEKLDEGDDTDEITGFARRLWTDHFRAHFEHEEDHVLPALSAVGAGDLARQIQDEHKSIHAQVRDLASAGARHEALRRLADDLQRHARFEEREAFPTLEERADEDLLEVVGEHLHHEAAELHWDPAEWP